MIQPNRRNWVRTFCLPASSSTVTRPRVEPHRAVLPVEAADDAAPVLHGAEAAAQEEQGRRAARRVDSLEPSVSGRNHELS
jgi:hypothetical protein